MLKEEYDLIIIGLGPAGVAACIYAERAMIKTLVFESNLIGGKINKTNKIENYIGFENIKGINLSKILKKQLEKLKIKIKYEKIISLSKKDNIFIIKGENNKEFLTKSVIISTGTIEKKLEIKGEKELINKGISYCAICDGFLFKNKEVVVVGGGYSGCESALYLSKIAKKVYLIHYKEELKIELQLKKILEKKKNIEILLNSEIIEIKGSKKVEFSTILINNKIKKNIKTSAVFPCIGLSPNTNIIEKFRVCDKMGYIIVDEKCKTSVEGLFAAGDVIKKKIRQITTSVSDGTIAAQSAIEYINKK